MDSVATDKQQRTPLQSHAHTTMPGETRTGRTDPDSQLQVTLILRRKRALPSLGAELGGKPPHDRTHLTQDDLARVHGTTPDDIALIKHFADAHELEVCETTAAHQRTIMLKGSAAAFERAFDVSLVEMAHERGRYRAALGAVSVPPELNGIVQGVLGLNTRPCAGRRSIRHQDTVEPFWTVREMAEAYGFPADLNATNQSIGLIELGGGYHEEDLEKFFASLEMPVPAIRWVSVDGVQNVPAPAEQIREFLDVVEGRRKISDVPEDVLAAAQCTLEVTMDIELAAALAPGAEIVVYMAPNTEQGIHNAISQAISGSKLPCAISISWGEPETGVSEAYINSVDEVLRDAAMLGVTVCASSGDEGAMNGSTDGKPVVNFPASSPHVLSCGGSSVHWARGEDLRESAWNCTLHGMHGATGGGVSRSFDVPEWQKEHAVPLAPTGKAGRGVPDVAGPADPHRGCALIAGGERCASAGTSAVAPLWAALVACVNSALNTRCGYITPLLYELSRSSTRPLRDIAGGNNGFYESGPGWDACTGLGSPIVGQLIEALRHNRE